MMAKCDEIGVQEVTLRPGEFFFGGGMTRVHTLLGSCVAITLWHPGKHIGGMCHYLLPSRGMSQRLTRGYYADDAIDLFLQEVHAAHTRPEEYQVKVFGGGNMFEENCQHESSINVSRNNIETGMKLLQQGGFDLTAQDVGGNGYRKIFLELWNGDVWMQRGSSSNYGCARHCPK